MKTMKIAEFAGTIGAGKLTLMGEVKTKMRSDYPDCVIGCLVEDIRIGSELAHPENYLEKQILITARVTDELFKLKDFGGPGLMMAHRGLYDAQAFMSGYVKH